MKPGIHALKMPEYLAIKALSSGIAHTLLSESPFHAKYAYDNPEDDPSSVSDIGTAIHAALLEGLDVVEVIEPVLYPAKNGNIPEGWTNPAIREARDISRASGKIPLLPPDYQRVQDAVASVIEQLRKTEIADYFLDGKPEQTVVWEEGGQLLKIRPDWYSDRWHISVKTCAGSARPDGWIRRQLGPNGYDTGLAFYERGLRAHGWAGESRILVIQQEPPHRIAVIGLAPSRQAYAEHRADRAIRTWQQCMASGRWPAYSSETSFADLMPWEITQEETQAQPFTHEEMENGVPL